MWADIAYLLFASAAIYLLYRKYGPQTLLEEVEQEEEPVAAGQEAGPQEQRPELGTDLKKQQKKQKRKEEKQARQEFIRHTNTERERNTKEMLSRWQAEEAAQAERERQQQEALQKLKEQQQAKQQQQLRQWKEQFQVVQQGLSKRTAAEQLQLRCTNKQLIEEMVREGKFVFLQELGQRTGMKVKEVVQLIGQIEAQGRLLGVFDERGKYLMLEAGELQALRRFIQTRGRVTRQQLLKEACRVVRTKGRGSDQRASSLRKELDAISKEMGES